jgi:hypothetical protein
MSWRAVQALGAAWCKDCQVDLEGVIGALGERFTAAEAALIERMLRDLDGAVPERQMLSEIGLALAIHRRQPADDSLGEGH